VPGSGTAAAAARADAAFGGQQDVLRSAQALIGLLTGAASTAVATTDAAPSNVAGGSVADAGAVV
jgi:hypothetical protein